MEEIPGSVLEKLQSFHGSIENLEKSLQPYFDTPFDAHIQKEPLDQARIDLACLYTVNSLHWIRLCTKGHKPKDNDALKHELKRIKDRMDRLRSIEEQVLRPKLNQKAAKNFVRNALWSVPEAANDAQDVGPSTAEQSDSSRDVQFLENDVSEGHQKIIEAVDEEATISEEMPTKTKRTRKRKKLANSKKKLRK